MATTTNYSWSTPDDTALVKDGAAAIRSLGTAIDSTVFTNAGNAISKTIVDAKGDLIAATAADTVGRLAVGSNDQLLAADSATATGLKWVTPAAAMTILASGTIANNATGIDISSISGSYNELQLHVTNAAFTVDGCAVEVRFNNISTSSYNFARLASGSTSTATSLTTGIMVNYNVATANSGSASLFLSIPNYANSNSYKTCLSHSAFRSAYIDFDAGAFFNTAAIDRIQVYVTAGSFSSGSYVLYGVK